MHFMMVILPFLASLMIARGKMCSKNSAITKQVKSSLDGPAFIRNAMVMMGTLRNVILDYDSKIAAIEKSQSVLKLHKDKKYCELLRSLAKNKLRELSDAILDAKFELTHLNSGPVPY